MRSLIQKPKLCSAWVLFAVSLLCPFPAAVASDWPLERANAHSTAHTSDMLPEKLSLLWKYRATGKESGFEATAVVAKGIVYIPDGEGTLHAVHLKTGKPIWTKTFKETIITVGAGVIFNATYPEGLVLFGDIEGIYRALDGKTGKLLWKTTLESSSFASPTFYKQTALITTESGKLISLDLKTGKPKVLFQIDNELRCGVTIIQNKNGRGKAVLAGCDGRLHLISLASGKETAGCWVMGETGSTAAVQNGKVYLGTVDARFYSINLTPQKNVPQKPDPAVTDPAVTDTSKNVPKTFLKIGKTLPVDWQYRDPRQQHAIHTSPATSPEFALFGNLGNTIFAIKRSNGKLQWKNRTRSVLKGSPIIAGDKAVYATSRGRLHVVRLATGKKVWRYVAGGFFEASPIVADHRIVIGNTNGWLYCFGKPDTAPTEK